METQAQHLLLTRVNTAYRELMFRAEKMQTTLDNMPHNYEAMQENSFL